MSHSVSILMDLGHFKVVDRNDSRIREARQRQAEALQALIEEKKQIEQAKKEQREEHRQAMVR